MSQVSITISESKQDEKYRLIKFDGQIDESNVEKSLKEVFELIEKLPEGNGLILDFSGLEYLNSRAIGDIFDWHLKVADKKGKIVIAAPQENILDILEVVGVNQVMEIKKTVDEAKKSF